MRDASIAIIREIGVETGGSNIQFGVNPGRRAHGRHRDEPARVALLRARLQGHGLPHREDRRQARGGLHARRAPERHHARDAGLLRARHRLLRGQVPALGLREVPRGRPDPHHPDEVGGRGHGHRAHLQGGAPEGGALARAGSLGAHAGPARRRSRGAAPEDPHPRRPSAASPSPRATGAASSTAEITRAVRHRSLVPREHPRDRRVRARSSPTAGSGDPDVAPAREGDGLRRPAHRRAVRRRPRPRSGAARLAAGIRRHLQDGRHLRRRVRGAHALPLLDLRGGGRGAAHRRATRWSSSARARTASARASSSTTRASTPPSRSARRAWRPSWSTATPRRSPPTTTPPTASTSSR